ETVSGFALVFAHAPQGEPGFGPPPLRSAAGFDNPEQARAAAERLRPFVQDAAETGRASALPPDAALLGGQVEGSTLPLVVDGRVRGVLVVAASAPPSPAAHEALLAIAESAAVRLDHAALLGRVRILEEELTEKTQREEERGDEVLKLSE